MSRPVLRLLCGVPGSGKSTFAKEQMKYLSNAVHLSSDSIREELYGDESIQGNPAEVFDLMQKRAVEALNEGKDVLYDATNITRKDRASIISICPKHARIECYVIWAPIEECMKRDSERGRTVGKAVMDKMLKRFQAPYCDEGIDEIHVIRPQEWDSDRYLHECLEKMDIPHDNPHHTLSVLEHCKSARDYIFERIWSDELYIAAWLHDCGKPYVKSFTDAKGNPCEHAHYYQHQCVGAWMSYGFFLAYPKVAWLISTHMEPYFNSKYYRNLPTYFKRDIDILHKADVESH